MSTRTGNPPATMHPRAPSSTAPTIDFDQGKLLYFEAYLFTIVDSAVESLLVERREWIRLGSDQLDPTSRFIITQLVSILYLALGHLNENQSVTGESRVKLKSVENHLVEFLEGYHTDDLLGEEIESLILSLLEMIWTRIEV